MALAVGIVGIMLLSAAPMPAFSFPGAGAPSARFEGLPGGMGAPAGSPGAHPGTLAQPNGTCGIAKWCPAVTGSVTSYATTTTGLLSATGTVPCSVALISGACTAAAGANGKSAVTPYLNATNDVALNYTSAGVLAMAYTNYTTLAPTGAATCSPARPASTSEITFTTSANRGTSWAKPVLLGTPDCTSASSYPSAYDPALTSLGNGTIVLAYVQYAAKAPFIPPFINTSSVPLSRLVVTELYPGAPGWSTPDVVNVSNPSKSLTVAFSPARPSLGASGNTIYLTWMSLGTQLPVTVISHVAMLVSTTGGKAWSPTIQLSSGSQFAGNPNVLVQPGTGELYVAYVTGVTYCGFQAYCNSANSLGTPYSGQMVVASSKYNGTSFTTTTVAYGVRMNQTFGPFYNPAPQLAWGTGYGGYLDLAYVAGAPTSTLVNGGVVSGASITPDLYLYTSSNLGLSFVSHSTQSTNSILPPARLWGGLSNSSELLDLALVPQFNTTLSLEATVFNGSACLSGYCGAETEVALNVSANGTLWSSPWIVSGTLSPNGTSGGWSGYLTGEYEAAIELGRPANVLYAWDTVSCPSWSSLSAGSLGQCGTFSGTGGTPVWTLYGTSQVALSTRYSGPTRSETFTAAMSIPANATWGLEFDGAYFAANGSANVTLSGIPTGVPSIYNASFPGVWHTWSSYVGGAATPGSPYTFTSSSSGTVSFAFTEEVPVIVHLLPLLLAGSNCKASFNGYCPLFSTPPGPSASSLNPYNCQYTTCYNPPAGATSTLAAALTCVAYWYNYYYNVPGSYYENIVEYEGVGCANSYVAHTVAGVPVFNITYNQKVFVPVGKAYTLSPESWSVANTLCGLGYPTGYAPPGYASYTGYYDWVLECYDPYFVELTPLAWIGNGTGSVTTSSTSITITPTTAVNESVDWNITGYCTGSYDEYYFYASGGHIYSASAYNATPCYSGNPFPTSSGGVPVPLSATEKGLPAGTKWGLQASSAGASTITKSTNGSTLTMNLLSGGTYGLSALAIPIGSTGQYWIGIPSNASVTMPDFNGITVTFAIGSLTGKQFTAQIIENGLPSTSGWTLAITNGSASPTLYTELPGAGSTLPVYISLGAGSTYAFNGSTVTTSNGVEYSAALVNVSVMAINGTAENLPPWKASAIATGPMVVNITYLPSFYVTVESTAGGTTLSSSQFVKSGVKLNLTAKADANYLFTGWVGNGNGSVSSSSLTISVKPGNPITEFAVFRPQATPTWTLGVTAVGLDFGQVYALTVDGNVTYSGSGTFAITNVTTGTHTFTAPVAYAASAPPDIEYTPTSISTSFGAGNVSVPIGANGNVTVTYSKSYLLTLSATPGGSISGASNGAWLTPGNTLTLTAQPASGFEFVGWNGTGLGSYTGTTASAPVTANGPISEIAEFALIPPKPIAHYNLTVAETGLPTGAAWNATLGVSGGHGTATASGSQIVLGGLVASSYTLQVPTVYVSSGVRYVPNVPASGIPETLSGNANAAVTFTTQYLVTVLIAGNGTTSSGSAWYAAGSAVSLVATPSSTPSNGVGWKFATWNGSVAAENSTSATLSLSVNGPTTLTATFVPAYQAKSTTVQFLNSTLGFGLLGALLVVGLVLAFVMTRRRKPPSDEGRGMAAPAEPDSGSAPSAPEMEPSGAPPGDEAEWAEPEFPEGPA